MNPYALSRPLAKYGAIMECLNRRLMIQTRLIKKDSKIHSRWNFDHNIELFQLLLKMYSDDESDPDAGVYESSDDEDYVPDGKTIVLASDR